MVNLDYFLWRDMRNLSSSSSLLLFDAEFSIHHFFLNYLKIEEVANLDGD
jgi:hypothetical protein